MEKVLLILMCCMAINRSSQDTPKWADKARKLFFYRNLR